jgi:hypothetical protein
VTATDGTHTTDARNVTADGTGLWFANVDASGLVDGTITYKATVTDAAGNRTVAQGQAVKETVRPTITAQPGDLIMSPGQVATFTASATGPLPISVQWQSSTDGGTTFSDITGATSASYTFPDPLNRSGDKFRAVFSNSAGATFTNSAALTVRELTVTGVSPGSGPAAGGTAVTIWGTGFAAATAVYFGAVPATGFTVVSDSEITATSPPGTGAVDVAVDVTVGASSAGSYLNRGDRFIYDGGGGPPPPPPPPPPPLRGITAELVTMKVGKKKRLMIEVLFADTGAKKELFPSPFQKGPFKNIQVSVRGNQVVLTAKKGKKTVTVTLAG